MISTSPTMRILVAIDPVDFRKGIDGLAAICRKQRAQDPMTGCVFVFRNRKGHGFRGRTVGRRSRPAASLAVHLGAFDSYFAPGENTQSETAATSGVRFFFGEDPLYRLKEWGMSIRLFGQPPIGGTRYEQERLRSGTCGKIQTTVLPEGAGTEKCDPSVAAIIATPSQFPLAPKPVTNHRRRGTGPSPC